MDDDALPPYFLKPGLPVVFADTPNWNGTARCSRWWSYVVLPRPGFEPVEWFYGAPMSILRYSAEDGSWTEQPLVPAPLMANGSYVVLPMEAF